MGIKKQDIDAFHQTWGDAVISKDIDTLLGLYGDQAVLKPTLSNFVRRNHSDIKEYFVGGSKFSDTGFFNNDFDSVNILETSPVCFDNMATDTGVYEFSKNSGTSVKAHFSFCYILNSNHELQILTQHSSLLLDID